MYLDYLNYIAMLKKKETFILLVDLGIFMTTVYAFIEQTRQDISFTDYSFSIILLLFLSTLKFSWDCYKMYSDYSTYNRFGRYKKVEYDQIVDEKGIYPISQIKPSEAEESDGFHIHSIDSRKEYVFYSEQINNYIRNTELSITADPGKGRQVRNLIESRSDKLLPFLSYNFYSSKSSDKIFTNEKKLCLAADINLTEDTVYCHSGGYYDTYLTNIIAMQQLVLTKSDEHIIFDGRSLYPYEVCEEELRMQDITTSKMNNEIGVSTLAFTQDNRLILWNQNARAQSSSELITPSGSGSSDWTDITENSFTKTIKRGMTRELIEESSLKNRSLEEIGETRIIGFFRWIKKAGKPEFVGITKLNIRSTEILPEESEVSISSINNPKIRSLEDLSKQLILIKNNSNVSVPLYMNIISLEQYIACEPQEVIAFLKLSS